MRHVYDAANRLTYTVNGVGGITKYTYDKNNNVVEMMQYAQTIPMATTMTASAIETAIDRRPSQDMRIRYVYDANNRCVYTIDSLGYVTQKGYDQNGNLTATISFAKALSLSATSALTASEIISKRVVQPTQDQTMSYTYDAANRLIYTVDSLRAVVQFSYDALGNVTQERAYITPLASGETVYQADTHVEDRVVQNIYDAQNRLLYRIDSTGTATNQGSVTKYLYDVKGNLIETDAMRKRSPSQQHHSRND